MPAIPSSATVTTTLEESKMKFKEFEALTVASNLMTSTLSRSIGPIGEPLSEIDAEFAELKTVLS